MMKHGVFSACVLSCLSWSAVVRAAEPATNPPFEKTGPNTMETSDTVQVESEVVSVNKKTREIKLKGSAGEITSIHAGDEIRNFDQIKKGDQIEATYTEALAVSVESVRK